MRNVLLGLLFFSKGSFHNSIVILGRLPYHSASARSVVAPQDMLSSGLSLSTVISNTLISHHLMLHGAICI